MATVCTPEELHDLLVLCTRTGKLYWKSRDRSYFKSCRSHQTFNARFAGKEAFTATNKDGYKRGILLDKHVRAHQVVWAMTRGAWPDEEIDHVNGDPADNRPENLRTADRQANNKNRAVANNTATGEIGITLTSSSRKPRVRLAGKYLGVFDTLEEAIRVRDKKLAELGFHPNHGRAKRNAA